MRLTVYWCFLWIAYAIKVLCLLTHILLNTLLQSWSKAKRYIRFNIMCAWMKKVSTTHSTILSLSWAFWIINLYAGTWLKILCLTGRMFARRDTAPTPLVVARIPESTFLVKTPLIQSNEWTLFYKSWQDMIVLPETSMGGYGNIPMFPFIPHLRPPQCFSTALLGRLLRHDSMGQLTWDVYPMANKSALILRVLCRHGWPKAIWCSLHQ